ncbi:Gfo/Idh/MocA family protein [Mucilaginibacter ginkgonis]|nr:Gfo/Idh/MocA family oxidoreductase [Mucilaginibacter ginkgonis]
MEGLATLPEAKYVGAWSRRESSVNDFTGRYGGKGYPSLEALLGDTAIDAVYIATLPDSHMYYSIAALQAGKHVLCEKPAAVNVKQLDAILNVAKQTGKLWMEGMKTPFFPLYEKLKTHLENDPIGDVGFVRAGSSVAGLEPNHPNFSYQGVGGSIMGVLPYEAFLAFDWLGEMTQINTMGQFSGKEIDMFAVVQSRHLDGYAQLYCGFDLHGKGDALISGTKGHITIHKNWWNPVKATIDYLDGRIVELEEPFRSGGLQYETGHFCKAVADGRTESPVITHQLSRQMLGMLDAARQQIGLKFEGE